MPTAGASGPIITTKPTSSGTGQPLVCPEPRSVLSRRLPVTSTHQRSFVSGSQQGLSPRRALSCSRLNTSKLKLGTPAPCPSCDRPTRVRASVQNPVDTSLVAHLGYQCN